MSSRTSDPSKMTELFGIRYPIVQAGMIWCSGWELAAAVSNSGALGIIGSGSMYPDVLREHIRKFKAVSQAPFAVNVPLLYPNIEEHMATIIEEQVPIVFTSAGDPNKWTGMLKEAGRKVVHVVSSVKFAVKAVAAGVDAVVAEGFEAGGHNGREETTTMVLVPMVRDAVDVPLLAAGGIASGRAMWAAMCLGADGVQMGSRFVCAQESSAHSNFKAEVVRTGEGGTVLTLKELAPVRLIKNSFYAQVQEAYARNAGPEELKEVLGRARAKKGMFEGDLDEGELEIGQVSGALHDILPAADIVRDVLNEFHELASTALPSIRDQVPQWSPTATSTPGTTS
ncbi:MAG: nitronate monooxygenase [Flavobacteriales bacterium]|nr:nitronate monooxygenase [Flavobacteriales bacterium]